MDLLVDFEKALGHLEWAPGQGGFGDSGAQARGTVCNQLLRDVLFMLMKQFDEDQFAPAVDGHWPEWLTDEVG